jgi:hypothetical protein
VKRLAVLLLVLGGLLAGDAQSCEPDSHSAYFWIVHAPAKPYRSGYSDHQAYFVSSLRPTCFRNMNKYEPTSWV